MITHNDFNYLGNEENNMTVFAKTFMFETEMVVFKDLKTSKEINIIEKLDEIERKINNLFEHMIGSLEKFTPTNEDIKH